MAADEATWRFVDEHLRDDVRQLALKKSKYTDIDFEFALRQIQGRQKMRDKLPFWASVPRFVFPPSLALEQCSSEKTAKYKSLVVNGMLCRDGACPVSTMADLTGGFGIDTLSFAQSFQTCHYVEPQRQLCDIMAYNSQLLHLDHIQIHQTTMENFIPEMDEVDVIFADPSRRDVHGSKVVGLADCTPNILLYKDILLRKSGLLVLKLSPMLDIKRAMAQLPETCEVHVVAVAGECKEILFLLEKDKTIDVKFVAVNLKNDQSEEFCFTLREEVETLPGYANEVKKYLYEPNAAIMKTGGFNSVSVRFQLEKLHHHSHLYTSESKVCNFPGRAFEVQGVFPLKQAQTALKEVRHANVSVRNFPLTAEELRKKLKLVDGGEVYIFGTTLRDDKKVIIVCSKEK